MPADAPAIFNTIRDGTLVFVGAGSRDDALYWRRNKVKISLYLARDLIYAAVGATVAFLVGLALLRVFGLMR